MKTDNFDEVFRRKVESFHPPFSDDEIDRIQGYVSKHIPLSFWQRFGHTLTYSLGTIIIVSLLTTIIYQANENKTLLNKITGLSNKLEQKQAVITVNDAQNRIVVEKIDTVYVVKHITKEVPVIDENNFTIANKPENVGESTRQVLVQYRNIEKNTRTKSSEVVLDLKNANSEQLVENFSYKTTLPKSILENTRANTRLDNSTSASRQVEDLPYKKADSDAIEEKSGDKIYTTLKNSSQGVLLKDEGNFENKSQNIIEETSGKLIQNTGSSQLQTEYKSLIISDLKRKIFSPIDLNFAFDFSSRKFQLPQFVAKPKEKKSFKFPSIAMPNLKYRVGLGINADFGQVGTSILTDVLFAKRWSITSGVNMAFLGFEHFGDEDDFRRKTDKDFRNEHGVTIPTSNPIENIEAHQVLFRVPIYLNYRWSLRRDYTVLFSTGTDLDFHLKQFTSYSHNDLVRNEKHEGIEEKIPVTIFNNWMLSVGIEKRWKHFSIQANPYFSYQFKEVSYRKDDFIFGLKLNGFYRISR